MLMLKKKIITTLNRMNILIALTESVNLCYRELNINANKIKIIPNGVDLHLTKKN